MRSHDPETAEWSVRGLSKNTRTMGNGINTHGRKPEDEMNYYARLISS